MSKCIKNGRTFSTQFDRLERRFALASLGGIERFGDFVGPDASVGPDGKMDIRISVKDLQMDVSVDAADVVGTFAGGGTMRWRFGNNPTGLPHAEFIRINDTGDVFFPFGVQHKSRDANLYINQTPPGETLTKLDVKLYYSNGEQPLTTTSLPANIASDIPFNRTAGTLPIQGGQATFQPSQYATDDPNSGQAAGDIHITLDSLPGGFSGADIVELSLSDGRGALTGDGDALKLDQASAIWSSNPTKYAARLSYKLATGYVADIAVPPIRDTAGAKMTLRMVLRPSSGPNQVYFTQFDGRATDINAIDRKNDKRSTAPTIAVSPTPSNERLVTYRDPVTLQMVTNTTLATLLQKSNNPSYQHIYLNPGRYLVDHADNINSPLVIANPLLLDGDPNAVLTFTANSASPTQTYGSAILVQSSHVTLSGFKIRFQNPIQFNGPEDYASAFNVQGVSAKIVDVNFKNLDIIGPAPVFVATGSFLPAGPRAQRTLAYRSASGTIDGNRIRGGGLTIDGGPISITNNTYVGTVSTQAVFPPGYYKENRAGKFVPSYVDHLIYGFSPIDHVISGNVASVTRADESANSREILGFAYRFLYYKKLTGAGSNNTITGNVVGSGMGRRLVDDEQMHTPVFPSYDVPIASPTNWPEVFLIETYDLLYEGITLPVSPNRRILTIPTPETSLWFRPIIAGDVVAILAGPHAGEYRSISQVVDKKTFILSEAMPGGPSDPAFVVSIGRGLVNTKFLRNTVDLRGTTSIAFVMTGNQYGLAISENTIHGDNTYIINGHKNVQANRAIEINLHPNERTVSAPGTSYQVPNPMAANVYWTRLPLFGAVVSGNTINGVLGGIYIHAQNSNGISNTSLNRTYLSVDIRDNKFTGYSGQTVFGPAQYSVQFTSLITAGEDEYKKVDVNGNYLISDRTYGSAILDGTNNVTTNAADPTRYYQPSDQGQNSNDRFSYLFTDPRQLRVNLSGNWLERATGQTYTKDVLIVSAVANGTPTVLSQPTSRSTLATSPSLPPINPPSGQFIVDDGDAAYMTAGGTAWSKHPNPGYLSDHSTANSVDSAAVPTATATWTFYALQPGRYRIYATFVKDATRAYNAPYTVRAGSQMMGTYRVNQKITDPTNSYNGADWWALGGGTGALFDLTGPDLSVMLGNNADGGSVVADAVRLVRIEDLIAIDNGDATYSQPLGGSVWGYHGDKGHLSDHATAASVGTYAAPTATATWRFSGLTPGSYRIYSTFVNDASRAYNAPYSVRVGSRMLGTHRVNQKITSPTNSYNGTNWWALGGGTGALFDVTGSYDDTGSQLSVTLGNNAEGGPVVADAVRIERIGDLPSVPSSDGLVATYYADDWLSGGFVRRIESVVDFDWQGGSPDPAIDGESFSAQWLGYIDVPATGIWTITAYADDGARAKVNNITIFDDMSPGFTRQMSYYGQLVPIHLQAGQRYPIQMDYREVTGGANVKLVWSGPGVVDWQVIPQARLHTGDGLMATYYDNDNMSGTAITRIDPVVDFDWRGGSPDPAIDGESFSAQWLGYIDVPATGTWTFTAFADDGARAWVNNIVVFDDMGNGGTREMFLNGQRVPIQLQAGQRYPIRLDYRDAGGGATVKLMWSGPGVGWQVIPRARLHSSATPSDGLVATYYAEGNFTGGTVSRIDPAVDFDWGTGRPHTNIEPDTFSVTWTGYISVPATGLWTITAYADDGAWAKVNNITVFDDMANGPTREMRYYGQLVPIHLQAGQRYPIQMYYHEFEYGANVSLVWERLGTPRQVIPRAWLHSSEFSVVGDNGGAVVDAPNPGMDSGGGDVGVSGTDGGEVDARPASDPPHSEAALVASYPDNATGWADQVTDPRCINTRTSLDTLDRAIEVVANVPTRPAVVTGSANKTISGTDNGLGRTRTVIIVIPTGTPSRTTNDLDGVPIFGDNSNGLLAAVVRAEEDTTARRRRRLTLRMNSLA